VAHAGHDNGRRPIEIGWRRRIVQVGSNRRERLSNGGEVASLVIDQRNHSKPLVLGNIRASCLSFEQATRNARANALNTASM
jgi:hypothetical protein